MNLILKKGFYLTQFLRRSLLLGMFSFCGLNLQGQEVQSDICDPEQAVRFADYLSNTRQYKLATWELERLTFTYPGVDSIQLRLLQVLRLDQSYARGIQLIRGYFSENERLMHQPVFAREYVRLHFYPGYFEEVQLFLTSNGALPEHYRQNIGMACLLLTGRLDAAEMFNREATLLHPNLQGAYQMAVHQRYKKQWLAGTLSALVPGSGKLYTGEWKDGLIAMLLIGTSGFVAYRGFNNSGITSSYGWFFATVGTSFYLGNIYGSAISAKNVNRRKKQKIDDQIMGVVRPML
jgi:TM2 domain-containing membrane protein YozV